MLNFQQKAPSKKRALFWFFTFLFIVRNYFIISSYRRVGGDELRHLLGQRVRRRRVAAAGGESDAAHGEGQSFAGKVGEDAVESVLDVRQSTLNTSAHT